MKVRDLIQSLERANPADEVRIRIKSPGTVGHAPTVDVKSAQSGFDWERGSFLIFPVDDLGKDTVQLLEQIKTLQDKFGWSEYENRNLKADIKRLRKQITP